MILKLLDDYRGVLTDETYYTAGRYAVPGDMPEGHASNLIAAGRGVEEVQKKRRVNRKRAPVSKRSAKAEK